MARIKRLSAETVAEIEPYVQQRIKSALSTDRADRERVEDGMRRCYEAVGLSWHNNVVWSDSPATTEQAARRTWAPKVRPFFNQAINDINKAARLAMSGKARHIVNEFAGYSFRVIGREGWRGCLGFPEVTLGKSLAGPVTIQTFKAIYIPLANTLSVFEWAVCATAHDGDRNKKWNLECDAVWAWSMFFRDHLDLPENLVRFCAAYDDASSAGWWYPKFDSAYVTENPTKYSTMQINDVLYPHNETGPAVTWADGTSVWFWAGSQVPQWVIEDPNPLPKILTETDPWFRFTAAERWGLHNYLAATHAPVISEEADPGNPGQTLKLYEIPTEIWPKDYDSTNWKPEKHRLLVMSNASVDRDGTRQHFAELVPSKCRTATAAAAWQFGRARHEYATLSRAT